MCTHFRTIRVPPPWALPGYYSPFIPVILLPTCLWALQSWKSDTLFSALAAVFVARFLAIRFGPFAVKRRVPIVVKCLNDLDLILPLVLIVVDLTL